MKMKVHLIIEAYEDARYYHDEGYSYIDTHREIRRTFSQLTPKEIIEILSIFYDTQDETTQDETRQHKGKK